MAWPLTTRAICLWPLLAMAEYTRSRRMAREASLPPVRLLLVWPLTAQATSLRRIWMAAIFTDSLRTVYGALLPPDWVTQPVSRSPHAGHHATDGAGHRERLLGFRIWDGTNPDPGQFVFWRNGETTGALTVYYMLSGSASNGVDYETLSGSVTFPAGATYTTVSVTPIRDGVTEEAETVMLTLSPDAAYTVGQYRSDTVIIENDRALPSGNTLVRVFATKPTASENGLASGEFIMTRNQGYAPRPWPLRVNYALSGNAVNGWIMRPCPGRSPSLRALRSPPSPSGRLTTTGPAEPEQ